MFIYLFVYLFVCLFLIVCLTGPQDGCADLNMTASSMLSNPRMSSLRDRIPYFLDYSVPLFSSCPRIDRALCPGLRVILRALE